jgi:predicted trehalose synthase
VEGIAMTEPVTTAEIADLWRRIRQLHQQRPADPRDQAAVLALNAELLARIADQHAQEWGPCDHTTEAREIASEAEAIAQNAHRLAQTGGAKSQENPPPF